MTRHVSSSRWALALAILATAGGAFAAPPAWADAPLTLCVHQSSACPAGATDEGSDLQGALDAAAAHPASPDSPNVVDIEAGTYTATTNPGFRYNYVNPVRIVGAGSDSTTVAAADNVLDTLTLQSAPDTISISGLAVINQTPSGRALTLTGGHADHLVASTTAADAVAAELRNATLSNSTIYAQNGYAGVSALFAPNDSIELDDDTINGGTDAVSTGLPATIHRTTLVGRYGLYSYDAAVSIDDSLIEAQNGISSASANQAASLVALNDTLIGTQGATQGVLAHSAGGYPSDVRIDNSIIYAFPTSFASLEDNVGDHSTIEAVMDNYDGSSLGPGITRSTPIGDAPGFVAPLQGNYHLAADSELIDASATQSLGAGSSTTDRDGNPRVVTVNHAATPVDLGAYEYQPPAPAGGGTPGTGGGTPGTGGGTPGTGGGTPGTGGGTPGTGGGTPGTGGGTPGTGIPSGGSHPATPTHRTQTVRLTALGHVTVTGHRLSLRLSCTGTAACSPIKLTATAMRRHHRVTVASLSTRLSAGRTATLTLTLNRTGRALLTSTRRLTVTVTVTVRNGSRTRTVHTAHVKLT